MDPSIPVWSVLAAIYLPILPIAFFARMAYGITSPCVSAAPKEQNHRTFDQSMMSSFETMVKIGGYIMLFSILARFLTQLPVLSSPIQALLLGAVEITTGIQAVSHVFAGQFQGLSLCFIISFGGLCALFQTKSVLQSSRLSVTHYFLWKLLHAILSVGFFRFLAGFPVQGCSG